jgi:hypothetical protein
MLDYGLYHCGLFIVQEGSLTIVIFIMHGNFFLRPLCTLIQDYVNFGNDFY